MKTIKEKLETLELNEDMPIAMLEDWVYGVSEFLGTIGLHAIEKSWKLLHKFDGSEFGLDCNLELRQLTNNIDFVLGFETIVDDYTNEPMERFVVVMRLDCLRLGTVERYFGVKKLIKVNQVAVLEKYRENGIVSSVYKFLVNELGYTMISDSVQYNGARKLWSRLSNEVEQVTVDVVDLDANKIVKSNAQLNHGMNPDQYNREFWSEDKSKENIRFLLKRIQ
jgi:hypothetical protein